MPRLTRQRPPGPAGSAPPRWLLFAHQLPSRPSNLRVRTWRRLQQLGALPLGPALYALPESATALEDFEWLKAEVTGAGGTAVVFTASPTDAGSSEALAGEFRRAREATYDELAREATRLLARASKRVNTPVRRSLQSLKERLAAVERIDVDGSAGRDRVAALLQQLEERGRRGTLDAPAARSLSADAYKRRFWVTRPRPGVDRFASAWLIRTFIDPNAQFGFASGREAVPPEAVPFDMFGVELTHQGSHCTFETLCSTFGVSGPHISRIAEIVHDLDLKDGRFAPPEAPAIGLLVDGLQRTHADDQQLLAEGMKLFDALYHAFKNATAPSRAPSGARSGRRAGGRRS